MRNNQTSKLLIVAAMVLGLVWGTASVSWAVTGDDCTDPIVINLPGDLPYSDLGQTNCGRLDDYDATCMGYYDGGEDIIYELVVSSAVDLDITLDPKTTTYSGIGLDDGCPFDASTCLYTSSSSSAAPHGITGAHLEPGTYYIMIDTWSTPDCIPDFDLTITAAAGPQPGDDCALPIVVNLPGDSPYTDAGQTNCGRNDNYSATCLGSYDGGDDIIYELNLSTTLEVDVSLDPKTTTYTGIVLDDNCPPDASDCIATSTNYSASPHGFVDVLLGPGTYYIMIDTYPSPYCIPDFDLSIIATPPAGDDMQMVSIDNPSDGASFEGGTAVSVQATVKNKGSNPQSGVEVHLEIDDGAGYTYTDVEYTGALNQNDTEVITFSPDWTVPDVVADYSVTVWTALSGDADPSNDTLSIGVGSYSVGYSVEGFEDTSFPPTDWTEVHTAGSGWYRTTSYPHTGSASARGSYTTGSHWLITPQLDVSAKGDELRYWIRRYYSGYSDDWFFVEVSTGTSDTSDFVAVDSFHTDYLTYDYEQRTVDLSSYARIKGLVYVAFHYQATGGPYVHVDDVLLPPVYVPPGDMATISIDNPSDGAALQGNSAVSVQATVENTGGDPQSAVAVHLEIDDGAGYTYTDVENTGTLNSGETEQITFDPDWTVPNANASYTVKVWTALAGDADAGNDTLTIGVSSVLEGYSAESFENTTFPPSGWTAHDFDGGGGWLRSTTYSHTGDASAKCSYDVPNDDWLITPPLKIEAGTDDVFKFWLRTASTGTFPEDYMVRLSTATTDTSDFTTILLTETQVIYPDFVEKELDLDAYDGQTVYIAFHLISNDELGLYIDDVLLPPIPTQIAVSPDNFDWESFPDSFFDVYMYIGNVGAGQLDYSIELETAVSWLSVDPTSGSALGGEEDTITLSVNTTGLDGHYYNTIRVISNSGEKQDGDTVFVPVHLWARAIPGMSVSPDSFAVDVPADGTVDDEMYITNTGGGQLDYEIETEEWGKLGAKFMGEPASKHHGEAYKSANISDDLDKKGVRDSRYGVPPEKGQGGPDMFGYRWIDSDEPGGPTYSWVEISTTGTLVDLADDGNEGPFPIGFTFSYYGVDFTEFHVCSNGWISFVDATTTALTNDPIPDASSPYGPLALFWDDLQPATGGGEGYVYYEYDGLNRLIIEYDGVMRYGSSECLYTMEIILYSNGQIFYQYKTMTGDRLDEATIGIESPDDTDGLEVVYNAEYVHDNLAIRFSAAPAWLVFDPESGTVPVGEEDTIDVTFDATGILSGEFFGAFLVSGNDPDNPLDTVPAHMTVLAPDMTVSPDSIVSTGTEGAVHHETVNLGNTGTGDLLWSIDETIDWLSASPSSGTVPSGGGPTAVDLTIDCSALYAGDYYGELTINNNDPDLYPSITYKVYLHVGPDPDIAVTPDSFYVELFAGTYTDSTMNIANSGGGHLVFEITTEETGSPPKDTILTEGFEDAWPPPGWSDPDLWDQDCSGYYMHTGLCGAWLAWGYGLDEWLITPPLMVGNGGYVEFWWESSFYWSVDPYDNADLFVQVSTDGGSSWSDPLWTFGDSADVVNSGGPWPWEDWTMYPCHLDLTGYKGEILIAFHVLADDNADIAIDDVVVDGGVGGGWLTVSPESGVVNPSDDMDVTVTFNATEILGGEKFGNIIIDHNDPTPKGQTIVPVHMVILGPEYSIDPTSLTINATEGATTDDYLTVGNYTGQAPLIYQMSDDVDWLSESPSSGTVPAGNDQVVTVTVDGNLLIPGDYYAEIYVQTNDFDETYDTIPVNVHVGPDPVLRVKPESFIVDMFPGTIKDSLMTLVNDGGGTLAWEISIEYTTPVGAPGQPDVYDFLKEYESRSAAAPSGAGSDDPLVDKSSPMHLTRSVPGDAGPSLSPLVGKGDDTLFVQLPHDPDEGWSFATTDQGAGYKMYENFWGLTERITEIDFWGLCLIRSAGSWYAGDPNNLVFDITFYSDPPDDPTLPPTEVACTYENVVPSQIIGTGLYYVGFEMYFFDMGEFDTPCDLEQGWVSIQSKSAGEEYDWLMWASAKTGDGFSYQEGNPDPRYFDQAMILTGGGGDWLTVSPESGLTSPHDSTDVDVTFDATALEGGTWFADIIIDHNAPGKGQTIVPVRLHLLGANFSMYPESLVVDMLEGQIVDEHLFLSNPGGEGDLIFSMTDPVDWLSEHPDAGAVMPDMEEDVIVRVDGTDMIAGHYYTEITITTNDFDFLEVIVPVHVNVGPDPDIDVEPSYAAGVVPGCQYSVPMKIGNLGGGTLAFNVSIAQEPPMFTTGRTGVHDALETLRQAGSADPDMTPEGAYRTVGAERSTIQRSSGVSDGLLLLANAGRTADILLVDDDGGLPGGTYYDVELVYTDALDAGGYVYDYYVVDWTDPLSDGPDLTTMQAYGAVIWFCGETWGYYGLDVLTPNDEANLGAFLSGGGNLFLSAQDWLWASYPSAGSFSPGTFPYDYLHLASANQDVINDPYTCAGLPGSVAEGMSFETLRFTDNPDVPLYTDYLTTQSSAAVDVFDAAGGVSAIQYDSGTWRAIFTTTAFPGLVDGASRSTKAELMASIVGWLLGAGCPFSVTPETGLVDPESFEYLTLTFDGDAFEECADESLSCYLVITSNDPDEPQVTVEVSMYPGRGDVFDPFCLIELGDLVFLINYVLKGGPAPDPLCMGDCDPTHDGVVDSADLVYLKDFLYQGGMPPKAPPKIHQPGTIRQLSPQAPAPTPRKLK